tara:strand:+ start:2648 stop:4738 length:2091 start_codon:yes stop_codon:yes gene_type:complete
MKYFVKILLVNLFLFFVLQAMAQNTTNSKTKKADKAFAVEQYYKAAELYKKAYKKTKNRALKAEITFKQAECYRLTGLDRDAKRAESYYKRAIKTKYPDVVVYLRYADMLKKNAKYEEALQEYKKYVKLNPTDIRGEKGVKSCQLAMDWEVKPTRYKVALMPIINSRYSDFSPAFGNKNYTEIYFASSRKGSAGSGVDERTGESFMDIYKTRIGKKAKWSSPIPEMETINSDANEGPMYLNQRGSAIYFTKCKVEKKKQLGCDIYVSQRKGKLWTEAKKLQIKVDSGVTVGHPAVSVDESTIFFSSDQTGGYGSKDIWVVQKIKRNQWSDPMNLGPAINTSGDEMFPFLHSDGTLYFASDGHIGMGGLDILKSSPDSNLSFTSVINLKSPINSPADDFGMIIEKDGERGYFTSNRAGGKGGDDIYQFELPPLIFTLRGVVTDSKTGAIITSANVQLIGSDEQSKDMKTDNSGSYNYKKIKPITSYEIVASMEGYLRKKKTLTTVGEEHNKDFVLDFELDPIIREIILPRIEYDYAKWDLRGKSIEDLNVLIITLNENPNITIELRSHTDYRGTDLQNKILSQKRADACINYLIANGIDIERLTAKGMGESEPYVIDYKDGKLKLGDVLTKDYIDKLRRRKNREQAHQYNRRTTFKVVSQDYVSEPKEKEKEIEGPTIELKDKEETKNVEDIPTDNN